MNSAGSERDRFLVVRFYGVLLLTCHLAFSVVSPFPESGLSTQVGAIALRRWTSLVLAPAPITDSSSVIRRAPIPGSRPAAEPDVLCAQPLARIASSGGTFAPWATGGSGWVQCRGRDPRNGSAPL